MLCTVLLIVTGLIGLSMQPLKKQEWTEVSWRNNGYNAKVSVEPRLDHVFAIEYKYFQWLLLFAHYCHICSLKSVLQLYVV